MKFCLSEVRGGNASRQIRLSILSIVASGILTTTGCIGHTDVVDRMARLSAGPTGCAPQAIAVTNEDDQSLPFTWTAKCGNARYACSVNDVGPASCDRLGPTSPSPVSSAAAPEAVKAQAPTAAASPKPAATWSRYQLSECGISILLPAKPSLDHKTLQTRAGPTVSVTAVVELPDDGGGLAVICGWIPGDVHINIKGALDGARDRALQSQGATLDHEESVRMPGLEGRDIRFHVQDTFGRLRVYMHGREIISMGLAPTTSFSEADTNAYFASLSLTAPAVANRP